MIARLRAALADNFEIHREIGRGGTSIVYLTRDLRHDRDVALKVLNPEVSSAVGAERFLREIRIEGRLQHPNILAMHDSGSADGFLYFVMPFVSGESLRDRLADEKQLSVSEAVRIASEIADALAYAHARGIVHRDIKPANILLTSGHAMVADFGIARALSQLDGDQLTNTGIALGTPAYMSPEQGSGDEEIDGRSDIYSLGCVLYEMLAGNPPFTGSTVRAILAQHMLDTPTSLGIVRPDSPRSVHDVVERCLRKVPAERFSTAAELRDALGAAASGERQAMFPSGRFRGWRVWSARQRRIGIGAAVVLLAVVAVGVLRDGIPFPRMASSAPADALRSFAIPAFRSVSSNPAEEELADKAAFELAVLLRGWRGIRVANPYLLEGIGRALGFAADSIRTVEDGLRLAEEAGMGTLLLGELSQAGDSIRLAIYPFDVDSGREVGDVLLQEAGHRDQLTLLVERVARQLVALSGETDLRTFDLQRLSSDLGAVDSWLAGLNALERWRLADAERQFRASIAADSLFALPYHYLALTLSWQDDVNPWRLPAYSEEVQALTATSVRLANRPGAHIPWHEHMRLVAFHGLKHGDFELARASYDTILATDSTDYQAWMQRGLVEYDDPALITDSPGNLRPRKDLNMAVDAFARSVNLRPQFQIGYGRLFDIMRQVLSYNRRRICVGFRPDPDRGNDNESVTELAWFCPVWLDSIAWIPFEDSTRLEALRERTDRLDSVRRDSTMQVLRRWIAIAPDVARPHVLLSEMFQEVRAEAGLLGDRSGVERAADSALVHMQEGIRLADEVASEQLVGLANLLMATGEFEEAAAIVEGALRDLTPGVSSVPHAANAFLVLGQVSRALQVARRFTILQQTWEEYDGRFISFGDVEPILRDLRVHGAAGTRTREMEAAFTELWKTWSEPDYTPGELATLASNPDALRAVTPALVADAEARREWMNRLDTVPLVWRSYEAAKQGSPIASELLALAVRDIREDTPVGLRDAYVLGMAARELAADSLGVVLFRRVRAAAPAVTALDAGWGLQVLSFLRLAQSFENLGQLDSAIVYYDDFIDRWSSADPILQPLVEGARDSRHRLRGLME